MIYRCEACGGYFSADRSHARTCSGRCRMRQSRARARARAAAAEAAAAKEARK